jgi:hypothetical protein
VPTAKQNKATPEILPSDPENIVFFLSEINEARKFFCWQLSSMGIVLGGKTKVVAA